MSGTSMDAVDAALVTFTGDKAQLLEFHQLPVPKDLRADLVLLCDPRVRLLLEDYGRLGIRVGRLFAEAVQQLFTVHAGEPAAHRARRSPVNKCVGSAALPAANLIQPLPDDSGMG
jgi:anhydro-N-acetylmuramic acid kinase